MTIYEAAGYALSAEGDVAILASGERRQRIPLRHGADEIPAGLAAALRKAGQDPADYFCVAGSHVLRRAALAAWTAAVDARSAGRRAEKAAADAALAADIAARGRRALVFHELYLTRASLVYVRPMTPDEAAEFRPELRATGFVALGDWTPVSARIARDFAQDRRPDGWVAGQESSVFTVSDSEWTALDAGGAAEREAEKAEKAGKAAAEAARAETARRLAAETGEPVEIGRRMEACDGTAEECSFDLVRHMIRGDGTRFSTRTHCH